jgi:hypothetical protein
MKPNDGDGAIPVGDEQEAGADIMATVADMLDALKQAAALVKVARNYFPKSVQNRDRFTLENTNAAICAAIRKAENGS